MTTEGFESNGRVARGDDGFTLIELLVVIVILAILSAIVVFAVGGVKNKGQASSCKADYKTIQVAEEANFANTSGTGSYVSMAQLVTNGFLTEASKLYDVSPSGTTYTITAIAGNPNGCVAPPA
jgi:general secretion pathway protein G